MKNILLMTRNEGSDHIIEALMKYKGSCSYGICGNKRGKRNCGKICRSH